MARARKVKVAEQVFYRMPDDRRFHERREEEDSGAWKIVCEIWDKVAYRRHETSRRMDDHSASSWYGTGGLPRSAMRNNY
jgi:hypothetical protein